MKLSYREVREGPARRDWARAKIALVVGEGDIIRGDPNDNGADENNLTSYGFNKLLKQRGERFDR